MLRIDKAKPVKAKPTRVDPILPPLEPKAPKLDQQLSKQFKNKLLLLTQLRTHQIDTAKWTSNLAKPRPGTAA